MRFFLIVGSILLFLSSSALARDSKRLNDRFDYGIYASVNAPFVNDRNFMVDWVKKESPYNETKIAGSIALFGRVNFKRHYIQIEAENSFIRDEVFMDLKHFGYDKSKDISCENLAITFNVPLLYGYNFINKDKFELSFFGGPKMRYTYYNNEDVQNSGNVKFIMNEDINPVTLCCVLGIGAKISKLFVDFRYEFGVTVHNKPGTYMLYQNGAFLSSGSLYAKRSINLLSFSLGVIL